MSQVRVLLAAFAFLFVSCFVGSASPYRDPFLGIFIFHPQMSCADSENEMFYPRRYSSRGSGMTGLQKFTAFITYLPEILYAVLHFHLPFRELQLVLIRALEHISPGNDFSFTVQPLSITRPNSICSSAREQISFEGQELPVSSIFLYSYFCEGL